MRWLRGTRWREAYGGGSACGACCSLGADVTEEDLDVGKDDMTTTMMSQTPMDFSMPRPKETPATAGLSALREEPDTVTQRDRHTDHTSGGAPVKRRVTIIMRQLNNA